MTQPQAFQTLPVAQPEEFLPPISRWLTFGGLVMLLIAATSLGLLARLKYRVTVKAPITIRPTQELFVVQTTTEGIVKDIAIQSNQTVQAGDILATLENTRLATRSRQLQSSIQQLTTQAQQLQAQLETVNAQIVAATTQGEQSILAAEGQMRQQRRTYQERQVTSQAALQEAEANYRSTAAALEAARSKRDRYQTIVEAGALSLDEFAETQLAVRRQEEALQAAQARIEQTRATVNPTSTEVEIAQARIIQTIAQGEASLASLQQDLKDLQEQQAALEQQRQADQQTLAQVQQELADMTIRAPVTGVVQRLYLNHPEQLLQTGNRIASIAVSETLLELEAQVSETDIPRVEVGQTAQVRINGCPYTDFGVLTSTVTAISPDIFDGGAYGIKLQPASETMTTGKQVCRLQAGMAGQADIVTREEAILWALLRKLRLIADL